MVMNVSMFPDISQTITKNIKLLTIAAADIYPNEYPNLASMEMTDLQISERLRFEGEGAAAQKTEGKAAYQKRMYQGNKETVVQKTYAVEMAVTFEQRFYVTKNANFINQLAQYNNRSIKLTMENDVADLINLGFTGGPTGFDGQQYFSASHTYVSDNSVYSNLLDSAELGKEALEDALVVIADQKQEANIPLQLMPKWVHISTANILKLPELLKTLKDPESANNTHNAIRDFNLKQNLSHYFSDTDTWVVDTQVNSRAMSRSLKTKYDSYMDNPTLNLIERGMRAHGVYFFDQFGAYGNQGG